ncbi:MULTISPECIES: 4'-phosphopantetheinyl transferase family protein [Shewanella]|uniref:4'-phosphopantetheinyl transferase family protein n=1 Tax=Shewanella TaxID=22 RepID=UPI000DAFCBC2|nr:MULTISPECIES: 4'-phosphopantetheinyl transferase superfamily protein [Shewanella]PZP33131.1 MAG: 4-phosphopantetheinyl transferase [Shewanella oneidensis]MBW0280832.1 4-phosphopantetheinyl transferase [Shewanella xiamenensis]MCT8861867.1 4'-phosphopantetheinyl transferase superfamily protein [Shewanella xiamenensis]MCT8874604.1 4'-phosphopantetheinyl transferase superfamily protein [Shewanella xiamenensis]MDL3985556.1 4'-phosphopantetheinyl transferase superfamily protein [Shewanella xiamen
MKIELFFIPLAEMDAEMVSRCMALLSEDERAKVARYLAPKAQMNGLLVRAALRCVLSQGLQSRGESSPYSSQRLIAPQDWCFEYGEKGKPGLSHEQFLCTGMEFNLSHSGDWLLIALAQDDDTGEAAKTVLPRLGLGVDIERSRGNTSIYPILNHYFSPIEAEALLALEGEAAQRQRFFDLWALKESYIKATGLGLAQSLKSFAFELMPDALVQTHSNQIALRHEWVELKRREPFALPSQLKLYCEIKLVTEPLPDSAHPQPENLHVQSYFGRLNDEYRFGLSLIYSNALPNVQISMTLASIKSLLAVSLAD